MSDSSVSDSAAKDARGPQASEMFAQLVMQNTNMAAIFLGLAPNPQTGETGQDLDHARYFIDQLEMLEVKTKGNLDKDEQAMLKQSLAGLRMAFVEAVNHPRPSAAAPDKPAQPAPAPAAETAAEAPRADAESRKMFSKKYS